ncbi:4'-phosphopantetheinyl transferase superfamily protein [Streptomyces sp. C11-1]|uniref:4'-phosphopantetheinyl transferase superfamily protein n=1 Tax=Streptomyces durocortorensis TaxID=2811104 RepID=A0ABY9W4Y9_9ACTN|nr:4'-phosphopantetheinyl transferase superfamily protein [Streptomyces durocortorensis]WNF28366.1 4'-phosphopantetheinyl transferase superfamily protein [Streptomyces durocortorensis]
MIPLASPPYDGHRLAAPRVPGVMTVMGRVHPPDGAEAPAEDTWRAVLSHDELRRADAFTLDTDRQAFQYTRWLLRTELSRRAPVAPGEWEFVFSPIGKPAIHPRFASDIEFSLSHSGGVCLIGLTRGRTVGVDVQICDALDDPESIRRLVTKCLSPEERAALEPLAGRKRRDAVVQLWAVKEAYAKAVGLGVRLPFRQIALGPDGRGGLALRPTSHVPDPAHWTCHAPQAPPGFRIGVCVAAPAAPTATARNQ